MYYKSRFLDKKITAAFNDLGTAFLMRIEFFTMYNDVVNLKIRKYPNVKVLVFWDKYC